MVLYGWNEHLRCTKVLYLYLYCTRTVLYSMQNHCLNVLKFAPEFVKASLVYSAPDFSNPGAKFGSGAGCNTNNLNSSPAVDKKNTAQLDGIILKKCNRNIKK